MLDMITRRNNDFLAVARAIYADSPVPMTQRELAEKASHHPAPCYYVTYDYALRNLSVMRRGHLPIRSGRRREMFREIDRKVAWLQRRHPDLTLGRALQRVLAQESASQFFIHPKRAEALLNTVRQRETA